MKKKITSNDETTKRPTAGAKSTREQKSNTATVKPVSVAKSKTDKPKAANPKKSAPAKGKAVGGNPLPAKKKEVLRKAPVPSPAKSVPAKSHKVRSKSTPKSKEPTPQPPASATTAELKVTGRPVKVDGKKRQTVDLPGDMYKAICELAGPGAKKNSPYLRGLIRDVLIAKGYKIAALRD